MALLAASSWIAFRHGAVDGLDLQTLVQLRLPRVLLAIAVGMGLAVSGAVLQAIFSNPLCEPYTLGISSGATLGAIIGMSLGMQWSLLGVVGPAFVGALVFAGAIHVVSLRPGTGALTLLLTGVMLGFVGSGLVALWMALADPNGVHGAVLWLMGDLSGARMRAAVPTLAAMVVLVVIVWFRWRELDALLTGEESARSLGVPVEQVRRRLVFLTSLIIGLCVSGAGMIGFVGLVVPHFVRFRAGSLHRSLLPLSALWGATTLVLADLCARLITRPYELPVGVLTALVGAPLFLLIILKRREITG